MQWIKKVFGLCSHKWVTVKEMQLHCEQQKMPVGVCYVLQCEHCGAIKQKKIIPS